MAEFIEEVLKQQYDHKTDLALITGDFNVLRWPFPKSYETQLLASHPHYSEIISNLNSEYENVLKKEIEDRLGERFTVNDLHNTRKEQLVTYADTRTDSKTGKEVPCETKLSLPHELGSRQTLDYIIELQPQTQTKRPLSLLVDTFQQEKFLVSDLLSRGVIK